MKRHNNTKYYRLPHQAIIDMNNKGYRCSQIAKHFGCCVNLITRCLRDNNVPKIDGRIRITDDVFEEINKKLINGGFITQIAKEYKTCRVTIIRSYQRRNLVYTSSIKNRRNKHRIIIKSFKKYIGRKDIKVCQKCYNIKPFSEFYRSQYSYDGYKSQCKQCERIYNSNRNIKYKPNTYKICSQCGKIKLTSEYVRFNRGKYGVNSICKKCQYSYLKIYQQRCRENANVHKKKDIGLWK